jgi:hypothetical protein
MPITSTRWARSIDGALLALALSGCEPTTAMPSDAPDSFDATVTDAGADARTEDAGAPPDAAMDAAPTSDASVGLDAPPEADAADAPSVDTRTCSTPTRGTAVDDERFGCGVHYTSVRAGDEGWTVYETIEVDETLELAWTRDLGPLPGGADLVTLCATRDIAGLAWRAPTIDDVRDSIAGGCTTVADVPLSDPSCLALACNDAASCEASPLAHYCQDDIPICPSIVVSRSVATDATGVWFYQTTNGSFGVISITGHNVRCVADVGPT